MCKSDVCKNAGILSVLFSLIAVPACANAGIPLMWFTTLQVLLGSAIFGVIEGLILARVWKSPKGSACGIMIGANYVSVIAGYVLHYLLIIACGLKDDSTIPFSMLKLLLFVSVVVVFIITVFIEWPFIRNVYIKSIEPVEKPWLRAIKASTVINLVSYTVMMILMFLFGGISMLTKTVYDQSASFLKGRTGHIYYYDDASHAVRKMTLEGKQDTVLIHASLDIDSNNKYLFARANKNTGMWDLCTMDSSGDWDKSEDLASDFSKSTTDVFYGYDGLKQQNSTSKDFCYAIDFRKPSDVDYFVFTGDWAAEELRIRDKKSKIETCYGLETNFIVAFSHRPTVLPGDIVIWEFSGRIMAMDLNSKHITQLARGKSPVVTLD